MQRTGGNMNELESRRGTRELFEGAFKKKHQRQNEAECHIVVQQIPMAEVLCVLTELLNICCLSTGAQEV